MKNSKNQYVEVLIVGAGLSGIGAAHHLQKKCPDRSFALLEARESIGGTWDLFRYPGIRSDSDMYTLGYSFRPWEDAKAIADGPAILKYIKDTAAEAGIDKKIKFNHKVKKASWSSRKSQWTVEAQLTDSDVPVFIDCNFIFICSGYYNYDEGYTPEFRGSDQFNGLIVHPQKWNTEMDYSGKKIVVIGSGATAVNLVPELAKKAELVTMLQRSPTYIVSAPEKDVIANTLRRILPAKLAYSISRWKNISYGLLFFKLSQKWPNAIKNLILKGVRKELGEDADIDKHFSPYYNPWDQRLCLVPDSDLFEVIKEGSAEVVTDHIQNFTENGILLKSGSELQADIIVTATGLNLQFMGNIDLTVDDKKKEASELFSYKGAMFNDVPNLAMAFGYTNASWTLKCDLTCEFVCRLLNHMKKKKLKICTPRISKDDMNPRPFVDFSSGYFMRSIDDLPKQGSKKPWVVLQNYVRDIFYIKYGSLTDKVLNYQ